MQVSQASMVMLVLSLGLRITIETAHVDVKTSMDGREEDLLVSANLLLVRQISGV